MRISRTSIKRMKTSVKSRKMKETLILLSSQRMRERLEGILHFTGPVTKDSIRLCVSSWRWECHHWILTCTETQQCIKLQLLAIWTYLNASCLKESMWTWKMLDSIPQWTLPQRLRPRFLSVKPRRPKGVKTRAVPLQSLISKTSGSTAVRAKCFSARTARPLLGSMRTGRVKKWSVHAADLKRF